MIRLRSLGQCTIEIGRSHLAPDAEMLFATALYLVVENGRPVPRRELIDLLWPAAEEARAQHSLRQALYKLKSFGLRLATEHAAVMLVPKDVDVDYEPFLREHRTAALEGLSEHVTGAFLPGYTPRISEPYAEWVERHRDVVHAALRRVLVAGIAAKKGRGDWVGVETLAKQCLSIDPLNEEATLAIAEAAAVHGSKAYALTVLDRYLKEIGPEAREIRLPATVLRRRIGEAGYGAAIPLGQGPFVGREAEMAGLNQALTLAIAGQGSATLLWGEAGIGKSRIATELTKGATLQRVQVVRVGCQSHDERRSLSAFVDLVPRLLDLRGALGCSPESMKYLKRLVEHDMSATTPTPDAREAELLFSNIRRSLFDLIDAIASEMTLVVVVEDVHWLDPMSWELLRDVVTWLATRRVLLILTSRDAHAAEPHPGRTIHQLRRVHVGPLPDAAGRELLDALLVHRPMEPEFSDWCLATSAGNPYYMSELAAHAVEDGGRYKVPVSLTALIEERLNRLGPTSRRVLQACAILGKNATLERVEGVLGQTRVDLLDSLDDLEPQGLIETDGVRLMIKHDLLAQAAMGQLSRSSRQLLHRHAAAALQQEGERSQASALLWACAEHWHAAGEVERALTLLRSCAQHSLEMGVPSDAARTLERAVEMTGEEERLPVLREWALALQLAGEWGKVLPVLKEIVEVEKGADPQGQVNGHTDHELLLVEAEWRNGANLSELLDRVDRCAHAGEASPAHRVHAATLVAIFSDHICCRHRAIATFEVVEPLIQATQVSCPARLRLQIIFHCAFGDQNIAVQAARALVAHEREYGNAATLGRSLRYALSVFYHAGYANEALAAGEEACRIFDRHGLPHDAILAASKLADICMLLGDINRAIYWHALITQKRQQSDDYLVIKEIASTEAELYLRTQQYDKAEAALRNGRFLDNNTANARGQAVTDALRIALRLFRDSAPPPREELDQFLDLHFRTRDYLGQDWVTYILYRALLAGGREGEARQILREYIYHHRWEGSSLIPELRAIVNMQLAGPDDALVANNDKKRSVEPEL